MGMTTGVQFLEDSGDFSRHRVQTASGAYPACCPMVIGALFLGIKPTTHLHLMTKLKCMELCLHSPYVFMACCLVKHREKFLPLPLLISSRQLLECGHVARMVMKNVRKILLQKPKDATWETET
jgi:hypothetical protein